MFCGVRRFGYEAIHTYSMGATAQTEPLLPEWCEQRDKNANLCTPSLPKRAPTE